MLCGETQYCAIVHAEIHFFRVEVRYCYDIHFHLHMGTLERVLSLHKQDDICRKQLPMEREP